MVKGEETQTQTQIWLIHIFKFMTEFFLIYFWLKMLIYLADSTCEYCPPGTMQLRVSAWLHISAHSVIVQCACAPPYRCVAPHEPVLDRSRFLATLTHVVQGQVQAANCCEWSNGASAQIKLGVKVERVCLTWTLVMSGECVMSQTDSQDGSSITQDTSHRSFGYLTWISKLNK